MTNDTSNVLITSASVSTVPQSEFLQFRFTLNPGVSTYRLIGSYRLNNRDHCMTGRLRLPFGCRRSNRLKGPHHLLHLPIPSAALIITLLFHSSPTHPIHRFLTSPISLDDREPLPLQVNVACLSLSDSYRTHRHSLWEELVGETSACLPHPCHEIREVNLMRLARSHISIGSWLQIRCVGAKGDSAHFTPNAQISPSQQIPWALVGSMNRRLGTTTFCYQL